MKKHEQQKGIKGVFWIIWDPYTESMGCGRIICCFTDEDISADPDTSGNGLKISKNESHMIIWDKVRNDLPKDIRRQFWNFFPRGRVEIRNGRIFIYANPVIEEQVWKERILSAFGLSADTAGPKWNADGSRHYRCHLDRPD